MELGLKEVDFWGKRVWLDGPSSVVVSREIVTLTPTNMQEDLTARIPVNDELANYYFGKPVYRTYIDKFAGHSYLIGVKFDALGYPVSDAITVVYKDTRSGTDKAIDYGSTAGEIISTAQLVAEGSNPVGWAVFGFYQKEGDSVSFNVGIESSYSSTQEALVNPYVDGKLVGLKPLNVSTSGTSVTLYWLARAGSTGMG